MITNIFYIILALFGLGVLVFIHELGHYFMARRVGMRVEAFGIGFGKPIFTWEHQGVKWNICMLPFGGYVRIAGMEKTEGKEPHEIPDGFFGKKPIDRIKVALAGPLVNILFALLAFCIIWATGGRDKFFSEFTHMIGWVDPQSSLYEEGIRPGDEIDQINHKPLHKFDDLKISVILGEKNPVVNGYQINYCTQEKTPFTYRFDPSDVQGLERSHFMNWILSPADFAIYKAPIDNKTWDGDGPMEHSGIQNNDRIVWIDGEWIFSKFQMIQLINLPRTLLTVKRGDEVFLTRIPRLKVSDLRISSAIKAELDDWQHDAGLKSKLQQLYFIPYSIDKRGNVDGVLNYIDENVEETIHRQPARSQEIPLQPKDQILAVDGAPVHTAIDIILALQTKKLNIVVQRDNAPSLSWKKEDAYFIDSIPQNDLQKIISTIGLSEPLKESGTLHLLNPVTPKSADALPLTEEARAARVHQMEEVKKQIEQIKDPKERAAQLKYLEESEKRLMLGVSLQDLPVKYNPSPFVQFIDVFKDTYRTLFSLVSGYLNPKWLSGPVGIVQVIHYGWTTGVKEALYWMAVISMNLGLLNLLPIPVLDGGHICFSIVESVTKKPIKAKTMEKLIIPFVVLLILFFIYVTYNDISRLFHRFF